MKKLSMTDIILLGLLALGFLGALKISFANFSGSPCPHIAMVPICYVVLLAYGLMIASVAIRHNGCKHYFFTAGWGTAFVIALAGSVAEVVAGGGVCPTSGGGGIRGVSTGSIPLCFASLAMLVVILVVFLYGPYRRACDRCNNPPQTELSEPS